MLTSRLRCRAALAVAAVFLAVSCSQERDGVQPVGSRPEGNRISGLWPGPAAPVRTIGNRLEETETVIGEGQRLYHQFNCSGCHAGGGGAIGPALMDDEWIYGNSASNIFWTIIEGRPQGMPAFGGRIAEDLAWKIAAYVRSLSQPADAQPETTAPEENFTVSAEEAAIRRGQRVFLEGPCALCHTIRGTQALATVGPDLTHLASREKLAAGTLSNNRGNLAGWILNPQNLKPGTQMPPTQLDPAAPRFACVPGNPQLTEPRP